MHRLQPAVLNMSINLRRADRSMTQHLLQRTNVSPARQQMSRKAVTQRVRTDIRTTNPTGLATHQRPNHLPIHPTSAA